MGFQCSSKGSGVRAIGKGLSSNHLFFRELHVSLETLKRHHRFFQLLGKLGPTHDMATGCTVWRAVSRLESGKWLPRTHGQACCGKEKVKLMRQHTGLEKHHNAQAFIMDSTGSGNTSHRSFRARKCLFLLFQYY